MAVAAELKKLLQELVVPELKEIKGEQKALHTELGSFRNEMKTEIKRLGQKIDTGLMQVNQKIDSGLTRLDEKMTSGFARLDDKIDSFRNEMRSETKRIDEKLETAMQVRERLTALESKVATLGH